MGKRGGGGWGGVGISTYIVQVESYSQKLVQVSSTSAFNARSKRRSVRYITIPIASELHARVYSYGWPSLPDRSVLRTRVDASERVDNIASVLQSQGTDVR